MSEPNDELPRRSRMSQERACLAEAMRNVILAEGLESGLSTIFTCCCFWAIHPLQIPLVDQAEIVKALHHTLAGKIRAWIRRN